MENKGYIPCDECCNKKWKVKFEDKLYWYLLFLTFENNAYEYTYNIKLHCIYLILILTVTLFIYNKSNISYIITRGPVHGGVPRHGLRGSGWNW